MKNLFLIAALALIPWAANAQNSNSKFTITPRIGRRYCLPLCVLYIMS